MAVSSLFALIDDIASMMDDVATMTKVAATKTSGVLGDDLALNAQQVTGVSADRELPVVWGVAKGSFKNKAILVPAALLISGFIPWAVMPLMMLGGAFLCFEGVEKLLHAFGHHAKSEVGHEGLANQAAPTNSPSQDRHAFEQEKISGAVRTDFILSAEIVVITLGLVAHLPFATQLMILVGISILTTIGVYGLVAGIVKIDDAGLHLSQKAGLQQRFGFGLLTLAPYLMRTLSVVGTFAMFTVGGGILLHGLPQHHDIAHAVETAMHAVPMIGGVLTVLGSILLDAIGGLVGGVIVLGLVTVVLKLKALFTPR